VWLTGIGTLKGNAATVILSSTTTPSPSTASTSGASGVVTHTSDRTLSFDFTHTETVITTPAPTQSSASSSSGGVTGGAAAGIVIGLLALAAVGIGAFFFVRRRQRRDSYEKQYESSGFGSSSGSMSRPFGTDQRLEPGMVQKRESVGSLADEQDYSRKILRVHRIRGGS
jgi:cell wall integrity and stress response component